MTVKSQNKLNAVYTIRNAAALYKANLVGKQFLYYFDHRFIEVIYKTENFKHMTGAGSALSANTFYQLAVEGKLTGQQIDFNAQHPYDLARKKLTHLERIASLATAESFMLEEIITSTRTYNFGTTDLNFTLCFNQHIKDGIVEDEGIYHVESLRHGDNFSKSRDVYTVDAILYKPNDAALYDTIAFLDKSFKYEDLPDTVRKKCSAELLEKMSQ